MLTKEQDNVLTILAQRIEPNSTTWNTYVLGYWICYICGCPFLDHESHGFVHFKELNISAFA